MTALVLLLWAAAGPAAAGPSAPPVRRPGTADGFVYPGDPGSEGISDYYREYARQLARLPKASPGRPIALEPLAWMEGCWEAVLRDYEYNPPAPMKILELGRGLTQIAFTPDQRWLRIETSIPGRWMGRYIGFDRGAGALVMRQIGNAGMTQREAFRSQGWRGNRLAFGPAPQSFFGLPLTDRVTFVRTDEASLRIVVEGRLASGRFVAMDDLLLRRLDPARCSKPG